TGSYTLSIGGAGMSGTASLTCTGAPTGAKCSVPASEPFSATTPTTFNLTVTTTARTTGTLRRPTFAPVGWSWAFAMLGIVVLPRICTPKRSARRYLRLAPLTLLLLLASCGGGSSSSTPGPQPIPNGTPAGTYTLNVKATSGSATQVIGLTFVVQ